MASFLCRYDASAKKALPARTPEQGKAEPHAVFFSWRWGRQFFSQRRIHRFGCTLQSGRLLCKYGEKEGNADSCFPQGSPRRIFFWKNGHRRKNKKRFYCFGNQWILFLPLEIQEWLHAEKNDSRRQRFHEIRKCFPHSHRTFWQKPRWWIFQGEHKGIPAARAYPGGLRDGGEFPFLALHGEAFYERGFFLSGKK